MRRLASVAAERASKSKTVSALALSQTNSASIPTIPQTPIAAAASTSPTLAPTIKVLTPNETLASFQSMYIYDGGEARTSMLPVGNGSLTSLTVPFTNKATARKYTTIRSEWLRVR